MGIVDANENGVLVSVAGVNRFVDVFVSDIETQFNTSDPMPSANEPYEFSINIPFSVRVNTGSLVLPQTNLNIQSNSIVFYNNDRVAITINYSLR